MASNGNFIAGAIKRPGALTAKANAAGMTVQAFAKQHQHDPGVTGDECRFYLQVLAKNAGGSKQPSKLATAAAASSSSAKPKFGSSAWDARYGVKRFGR